MNRFLEAYELVNGVGAFPAILPRAPKPGACAPSASAVAAAAMRRSRRAWGRLVACLLAASLLLAASPASAQLAIGPNLRVNKLSGVVEITNPAASAFDFKGYEITSPASSLNLADWSSLSDRNVTPVDGPDADAIVGNGVGETWDEAGGASNAALQEGFLLGSTSISAGGLLPLGLAYNYTLAAEDLVFKVRDAGGVVSTATVSYVSRLPADFNVDGAVDATDLGTLTTNFGSTTANSASGDADGDADVDANDFLIWQRFQGASPPAMASGSSVPEPGGLAIAAIAFVAATFARRRIHPI